MIINYEILQLILSIIALVCFVIGIVANSVLLFRVVSSFWRSRATRRYDDTSVKELPHSNTTRAYIMFLSTTDMMGLMVIPMSELLGRYNKFATLLACQCTLAVDWMSKLFVAMLLAVLAIHRYKRVCLCPKALSVVEQLRITEVTLIMWSCVIVGATVPVFLLTKDGSEQMMGLVYYNMSITYNDSDTGSSDGSQCALYFTTDTLERAMWTINFVMGCVLPGCVSMVFTRLLLHFLNQKSKIKQKLTTATQRMALLKSKGTSQDQCHRIASRNLTMVIVCYFVCFTPYWSLSLVVTYFLDLNDPAPYVTVLTIVSYLANLAPYIHACINPVLCLRMNKNLLYTNPLRQSRKSGRENKAGNRMEQNEKCEMLDVKHENRI